MISVLRYGVAPNAYFNLYPGYTSCRTMALSTQHPTFHPSMIVIIGKFRESYWKSLAVLDWFAQDVMNAE